MVWLVWLCGSLLGELSWVELEVVRRLWLGWVSRVGVWLVCESSRVERFGQVDS